MSHWRYPEGDALPLEVLEDAELVMEQTTRLIGERDPNFDDVIGDQCRQQPGCRHGGRVAKQALQVFSDGLLGTSTDLVTLLHRIEVLRRQCRRAHQTQAPTSSSEVGEREATTWYRVLEK